MRSSGWRVGLFVARVLELFADLVLLAVGLCAVSVLASVASALLGVGS